jgi:two-component system sensor histidine kinase YesM
MPYDSAIYRCRIYMENTFDNNNRTLNFLNINEASSNSWYNKVNQLNGKLYWTNSYNFNVQKNWSERLISCARVLKDYGRSGRAISYISIDIREREIYNLIEEAEKTINGEIYLVDNNNGIISCKNTDFIGKDIYLLDGFSSTNSYTTKNSRMKINGKESLVIHEYLPELDWNIVAVVSVQNFVNKAKTIFVSLLQVSTIAFLLSLVLAALLSGNITVRIRKLTGFIHKVDVEKYEAHLDLDVSYKDEISELINAYNNMIYENHILVNEVYKKNLEKKSAEIKVLQAQINPHFLYNALDTANWMAQKYKAKDIMKFLKKLSNFYRLSLSVGRSVVSINNEIEHVKSYVDIQKIKTNDEFEANYKIPPEILNYSIPKLTLQPIVENAIIHGTQEADERKGLIEIEGSIDNSIIKLTVRDNGIGMDQGKLKEILCKIQKQSDNSGSYGLRNVNQRIKHYFGESYGINIFSVRGEGTIVEVTFPAVIANEDN